MVRAPRTDRDLPLSLDSVVFSSGEESQTFHYPAGRIHCSDGQLSRLTVSPEIAADLSAAHIGRSRRHCAGWDGVFQADRAVDQKGTDLVQYPAAMLGLDAAERAQSGI